MTEADCALLTGLLAAGFDPGLATPAELASLRARLADAHHGLETGRAEDTPEAAARLGAELERRRVRPPVDAAEDLTGIAVDAGGFDPEDEQEQPVEVRRRFKVTPEEREAVIAYLVSRAGSYGGGRSQEALIRVYSNGQTPAEAAAAMHVSPTTVAVQMHRARRRIDRHRARQGLPPIWSRSPIASLIAP